MLILFTANQYELGLHITSKFIGIAISTSATYTSPRTALNALLYSIYHLLMLCMMIYLTNWMEPYYYRLPTPIEMLVADVSNK